MATVQLGPNDTLEVPDEWDAQQVTNHIREVRPGLFVDTNLTYNPPAAPPKPSAGTLKFYGERQAALDEQRQIDSILERLNNTQDAGIWERAGELLARGGAQMASSIGSLARAPLEVAAENLPTGVARALAALWQASDLARVNNIGTAGDELLDLIPRRAPSFGQARTLAANSEGLERIEPFLQMMAQAAGENAPQIAASAGVAGLPILPGLSHTARAALGSFLTALPQESGGIYQGMRDKGVSATRAAAITSLAGPLSAALETVGEVPIVGRMLGEGSRSLRKLPGRMAGNALLDGGTEVLQEGVGIGAETAAGKPPTKEEIIERVGEAGIGGLGGGLGASTVTDLANRAIYGPDKVTPSQPPKPDEVAPHRFVKIAEKYGVDPSQIEVVPQKIGADELKSIGHEGDVQAYVTPEGKIRVFEPSVTSDKEFDQIIREEVAHKRLSTPEGRAAVAAFTESNPLSDTEREALAQYTRAPGETELQHRQRLTDEFLAKLDRDAWWTKLVDRFSSAVKNTFGITLNNREAGRSLLRSIPGRQAVQQVQESQVALPAPAPASKPQEPKLDVRKSRDSIRITEDVAREFPGLKIKYNDPLAEDDGKAVQVDPEGAIRVMANRASPKTIRRDVIEAAVKSGTMLLREGDREHLLGILQSTRPDDVRREANRLGADMNTGDGRMKVLASMLSGLSPKSPILRRLGARMKLSGEDARVVSRAVNVALDRFRSAEPQRFDAQSPEQIFADNHAVFYGFRPFVQRLKDAASEMESRSLARRQFGVIREHVEQLHERARARILDDPRLGPVNAEGDPVPIDPGSSDFLMHVRRTGIEVSARDRDIHHIFRTENYARAFLRLNAQRDQLGQLWRALREKVEFFGLRTYSPEQLDQQISAITSEIEKLMEAAERSGLDVGEIEARASEIRASDDQVPEARAAQRVLANPVVAAMVETIDQIDDSRVTPRPLSDLTEHHASQAQVAHSMQRAAYRHLADTVKEAQSKWLHGEYAKQLTSLRKQLASTKSKSGSIEVQIHDIIQTLARSLGLSGSLQSREAATLLRDQNSAIARMALALSDAAPDTSAGQLREAIIALPSGALIQSTRLRELAGRAGVSEELLSKVLKFTRDIPEFHNAVVSLFERASTASQNATVTAIEQIENALEEETEQGDQRAQDVANQSLSRLRGRNRELIGRSNSIEAQLAQLEDERLYWEKFREFTSSEVADPDGERRMIHPIENGWILNSFTHPEGEQPEITLRAGDEYTQDTLNRLIAWQQNAAAATAANTVDRQTALGLISAQQAVSEFISANFTQDQIFKALAPGKFMGVLDKLFIRTAENLAKYVPGFFGDRIAKAASIYDNTGGKIERLKTKHVANFNRMFKRAAESLGLNLRVPGEAARLGAAYNEASHRLRQTGSGVAEGDTLLYDTVRGKTITPELLNLIRYTRTLGREGQQILAKHLYGGVRVDLPGRQVVRPPAETGDLGLGRLPNQAKTFRLSKAYQAGMDAQGHAVATKPDSPQVIQFWNGDPDALLSAVDDMNRQDFGLDVDKVLKRLAREAMNGIRMRGDTVPNTIDEWVERLSAFAPDGIGGRDGVRKLLLDHLAQYGRVAISKHPVGSKAPIHGPGVITTEDDRTEFSSPASKVVFPGSYYEYGSSNGLASFLGRVADMSHVEYLAALKTAASHLEARRFAIEQAINGDLTPFHDEIRYHTNDLWSGQAVTKERAQLAMNRMRQHAERLTAEHEATKRGSASIKPLTRIVSSFAAWILAGPRAMMTNVLSGPIGGHQLNKQVFGLPQGTLQTMWNFALASPHFVYDMVSSLANTLPDGYVPAFLNQREMRDYLESDGIGGSYSREELAEADKFADGQSESFADRVYQANQNAARAVQDVVGVRLGDRSLNRFGVRQVIPPVIRKLNRIAAEYAGRLAALGVAKPDASRPETMLSDEDTTSFRGVRELLSEFGNPEEILLRMANGEVDSRYFWRSDLGRRIGTSLLYRFNPASRTNRPLNSDMTLFLGWPSHQLNMMAAAYRTPADTTRSKKILHMMTNAASDALVGITAFYLSAAAGGVIVGAGAQALRAIGRMLAGDPPPEDDGLFAWLEHKLAFIIGALKNIPGVGMALNASGKVFDAAGKAITPAAKLHPGKAGFWDRPVSDIAIDIAKAGPASFGLSMDSARIPFISMLQQGAGGLSQAARGAAQYVAGWGDPGAEAGAKADIKAGIRTSMGMYGFAGATLSDLLLPGGQEDRMTANAIKDAAQKEGIRIEAPSFSQDPFSMPTPIRKSLMEYGRRLADGDQSAAKDIDGMAKYVYDRAYNRTINNGGTDEEAAKSGETAVKGMLRTLNPVEHAIGHTLSQEQYDALKKRLGTAIDRDEKAANAVIDQISSNPPAGSPFNPSESMRSSIKAQPQPKRSGRRRTLRGASTRRSLGRRSRLRFARSIV